MTLPSVTGLQQHHREDDLCSCFSAFVTFSFLFSVFFSCSFCFFIIGFWSYIYFKYFTADSKPLRCRGSIVPLGHAVQVLIVTPQTVNKRCSPLVSGFWVFWKGRDEWWADMTHFTLMGPNLKNELGFGFTKSTNSWLWPWTHHEVIKLGLFFHACLYIRTLLASKCNAGLKHFCLSVTCISSM